MSESRLNLRKEISQLGLEDCSSSKYFLFSFYDSQVQKFMPPGYAKTKEDIIRQASSIVNFSNSLVNKFPEDYSVHIIGYFDEDLGVLICLPSPQLIVNCSSLKTEQSIQFDELRKEIEKQRNDVNLMLSDYHKCVALTDELEKKVKAATALLDSAKVKTSNNVEKSRKKFLDMLFG